MRNKKHRIRNILCKLALHETKECVTYELLRVSKCKHCGKYVVYNDFECETQAIDFEELPIGLQQQIAESEEFKL